MILNMNKVRMKVIFSLVLIALVIADTLYSKKYVEEFGYLLNMWDGVVVISVNNIVFNLVAPLLIVFYYLYDIKDNFRDNVVIRKKTRLAEYHSQIIKVYFSSLYTVVLLMITSGIVTYTLTENADIYITGGLLRGEFDSIGLPMPKEINYFFLVLKSVIINSIDLFITCNFAYLIYWLFSSQITSIISVIVFSMVPLRTIYFNNTVKFRPESGLFYMELIMPNRLAWDFLIFTSIFFVLELIAQRTIPKKDFLIEKRHM